jgi:hypothetical protein
VVDSFKKRRRREKERRRRGEGEINFLLIILKATF